MCVAVSEILMPTTLLFSREAGFSIHCQLLPESTTVAGPVTPAEQQLSPLSRSVVASIAQLVEWTK
jgi:hypothetical protein